MNIGGVHIGKVHLELLRRIEKGAQILDVPNRPEFFRFKRGRTLWAKFLLTEMRKAGLLTEQNQVTASGSLWLLLKS